MTDQMMRAYAAFAPDDIRPVTLPMPEPDDYEVLVKNEGCVFCNTTDRMIIDELFATPSYPVVFGHEDFGTVVKVGKKVTKYKLGDRVICANAIVNGYNGEYYSSWGGFAEYGIAGDEIAFMADGGKCEGKNAYRGRYAANFVIPSDLPMDQACLAFSLCETASALLQVGDIKDKTVVVLGTGFVGYSFVLFAKEYGAKQVVCLGRREERLAVARRLGADATFIDVDEAAAYIRDVGGAHVVLEATGNYRVVEKGLPYLKQGGMFAVYAVPHRPYSFDLMNTPENFTCRRIGPAVGDSIEWVAERLRDGRIPTEVFLTHHWSFDQVPAAFEQVRRGEVIKGLVTFDQ